MPTIASIFRHPVKGLTPEPLNEVELKTGEYFPGDRKWAVEAGPSGFDPDKPTHISKMKFTVLARFPDLARLKTRLGEDGVTFHIENTVSLARKPAVREDLSGKTLRYAKGYEPHAITPTSQTETYV